MQRFAEKTHLAGGPRAGYALRRQALEAGHDSAFDLEAGLSGLVERGLLTASESGDYLYLTEQGVESLTGAAAG
jgi:hypothetical protein